MSMVKVFDLTGSEVGKMKLKDEVFGAEVNEAVLHQVVKAYLANQRQGTQSALTRAEVSGGGCKPWKQKGTGRARQGSIRAPQWTHGGVVFAPKPRDYRIGLNKKVKKTAMVSALSAKVAAGEFVVVDNFDLEGIKTKTVATALNAIGAADKALVVTDSVNKNLVISIRNMEKAAASYADVLNVYEVLNCKTLVMTKAAVKKLEEVYA